MALNTKQNLFSYLEKGMKDDLRKTVCEKIINDLTTDFESKVRDAVEKCLSNLDMKINCIDDLASIQRHLDIYIKYNEEDFMKLNPEIAAHYKN